MKNNKVANKYFQLAEKAQLESNFSKALEYFNLCLCHAESGSSNILETLKNRFKIYYEVKQFDKCLENIRWAQKIKGFNTGCQDFLEIIKRCEEAISQQPKVVDFFKLSLPANKKLPFIADCLEVKENEIYGRYIATNKDLSPGDIIVVEEPFYKVLDSKLRHLRCCICLKQNMLSLIPCSKCSRAMFCSSKCQNSSVHYLECGMSKADMDSLPESLLQRMIYQVIDICGSIGKLDNLITSQTVEKTIMDFDFGDAANSMNEKNQILAATSLTKREPCSADTKFHLIANRLIAKSNDKECFINNYLGRCMKSITVNFFHFLWTTSDNVEAKGFALCVLSAFFAHSCDPNVEKIDVDNKFVFIVRKPIKANEQLNMCYDRYSFMKYSFDERQQYFRDVYKFQCDCVACRNDYPTYDVSIDQRISIKSAEEAKRLYESNGESIRINMDSYPSHNICKMMAQNVYLLNYIGNALPF